MHRIQSLPLSRWVRARVGYAIGTIKRLFHFIKVRYRGLAKNGNRLLVAPKKMSITRCFAIEKLGLPGRHLAFILQLSDSFGHKPGIQPR